MSHDAPLLCNAGDFDLGIPLPVPRALHNPEQETVLRAVFILGEKHIRETLPYLTEMLIKSDNPFIQEALIMSLCKFHNPRIKEIISKYTSEKYSVIIRNAAENCLKEIYS